MTYAVLGDIKIGFGYSYDFSRIHTTQTYIYILSVNNYQKNQEDFVLYMWGNFFFFLTVYVGKVYLKLE